MRACAQKMPNKALNRTSNLRSITRMAFGHCMRSIPLPVCCRLTPRYGAKQMKKLFWKLFPPYEVKLTIEEAHSFLSQTAKASQAVIEPGVIALAKDTEKTIYSVRIDNMKPDHLAMLLITNVIRHHLGSGHFHTYRGVLNGVGNDMLHVWHATQIAMQEHGYITKQDAEVDNKWIKEQIKNVG